MSSLAKGVYFWRSAWKGFRRAPFVHLSGILTLAVSLFIVGLTRGVVQRLDALLALGHQRTEVTVYLVEGATESQAQHIAAALTRDFPASAKVVTPQVALDRLRTELGNLGEVLADLPKNPLPISLELRVDEARRNLNDLRSLASRARALPGVAGVDYGEQSIEQLSALARAIRFAGFVAFAVAGLGAMVMVASALQLAIYARRSEIEIQKLVGATDRFVRAPFLIEGAIEGLIGALLAAGGLAAFIHFLAPKVTPLVSFLSDARVRSPPLDLSVFVELLLTGCLLGLLASFAAVRRFSRA